MVIQKKIKKNFSRVQYLFWMEGNVKNFKQYLIIMKDFLFFFFAIYQSKRLDEELWIFSSCFVLCRQNDLHAENPLFPWSNKQSLQFSVAGSQQQIMMNLDDKKCQKKNENNYNNINSTNQCHGTDRTKPDHQPMKRADNLLWWLNVCLCNSSIVKLIVI